MLAMKQQFDEVNGEAIEAQPEQDAVLAMAANDPVFDSDIAHEREQYFDQILENPDMEIYDNDEIARKLSDTGNEQAYQDLKERADTSGGELGLNHALESAVDKKMQRVDGSLSQNLSESAQETKEDYQDGLTDKFGNWDETEELSLSVPQEEELELNMPEVAYMLEAEDPNVAVQAIYFELAEKGVDPNELDKAMSVGNDYDVLEALSQVAEDNGLDDIAEYGRDVQVAFAEIGVPEAINNVTPEPVTPGLVMNDPKWELENNQPQFQTPGMA